MLKNFLKPFLTIFGVTSLILFWAVFLRTTKHFFIIDSYLGPYYTALGMFVFSCIITPLWEELIFRHVPLQLTKKVSNYTKIDFTWIGILISSYLFAVGHDNGIYNILMQGLCAVLLCLVYISHKRGYWYTVAIHAGWNFGVLYLLPKIY